MTDPKQIMKQLDKQIKNETYKTRSKSINTEAYWNKILFISLQQVTNEDLSIIRTESYWTQRENLSNLHQKKLLFSLIKKHLS
jgi:metal-responsive CopG/Arc/MetJ family transcriptional regulator